MAYTNVLLKVTPHEFFVILKMHFSLQIYTRQTVVTTNKVVNRISESMSILIAHCLSHPGIQP